jgi:hypothetical protein
MGRGNPFSWSLMIAVLLGAAAMLGMGALKKSMAA